MQRSLFCAFNVIFVLSLLLILAYFVNVLRITADFSLSHFFIFVTLSSLVFLVCKKVTEPFLFIFLFFLLYLSIGTTFETLPFSDYERYFNDAKRFVYDESFFKTWATSQYPLASLIMSVGIYFMTPFDELLGVRVVMATCWALCVFVLSRIFHLLKIQNGFAYTLAALFGLFPFIAQYTSVFSSESVYLLFSLSGFYFYLKSLAAGKNNYFSLGLFLIALSFYARPVAAFLLVGICAQLFFRFVREATVDYKKVILLLCVPMMVFLPHAMNNWFHEKDFTFNSNQIPYVDKLVTVFGTNQSASGAWNLGDVKLVEQIISESPKEEIDQKLNDVISDRVFSDPHDFLTFALTTKVKVLWSENLWDTALWTYTEDMPSSLPNGVLSLNKAFIQILLIVFIFSLALNVVIRSENDDAKIAMIGNVFLLLVFYLFSEVQARYSFCIYPYLYIYAVVGLKDLLITKFRKFS